MKNRWVWALAFPVLLASCSHTMKARDEFKSALNGYLSAGCEFNADTKTAMEVLDIIGIAFPGVNAVTKASEIADKICKKLKYTPMSSTVLVSIRGVDKINREFRVTGKYVAAGNSQ